MNYYALYIKLRERWIRFHTKMAGAALGTYGGGGRIESPILFSDPKRVFVGREAVIRAGVMLSCVSSFGGEKYEGEIHIGDYVGIGDDVQISAAARVVIGSCVAISRGCLITDHGHRYDQIDVPIAITSQARLTSPEPVEIEDGCMIGAQAMIGPGVRLGRNSMVGFGAVVTKSVPPYSVVVGSPAHVIRRYDPETGQWLTSR